MRIFSSLLLAALFCGCAEPKKQGVSVSDRLDAVRIDQMVGNNICGQVFARTIVCLNARRERRILTALTNQAVSFATNTSLSLVTNVAVTLTTNQVIERTMNEARRGNFKKFLVKYFSPAPPDTQPPQVTVSDERPGTES